MVVPVSTLRAEVLWVLKVVKNHFSLRSCLGLNDLLKSVFPDSEVAKTSKLSKTKCGCLINYGLPPFFRVVLLKSINASPYFVMSYDEGMNKILQNEQMDLQARYWDNNERQFRTRYFDSKFQNRPNAANLHSALPASLAKLLEKQLLQISMDGANVNWSALGLIGEERSKQEFLDVIHIGSRGLQFVYL